MNELFSEFENWARELEEKLDKLRGHYIFLVK
jgi:hypothetical protein